REWPRIHGPAGDAAYVPGANAIGVVPCFWRPVKTSRRFGLGCTTREARANHQDAAVCSPVTALTCNLESERGSAAQGSELRGAREEATRVFRTALHLGWIT